MSTCVIVFKEKQPAKEFILKLREAQTPILNFDLIEPLNNKIDDIDIKMENSEDIFINELNFDNVKLLNPTLARK